MIRSISEPSTNTSESIALTRIISDSVSQTRSWDSKIEAAESLTLSGSLGSANPGKSNDTTSDWGDGLEIDARIPCLNEGIESGSNDGSDLSPAKEAISDFGRQDDEKGNSQKSDEEEVEKIPLDFHDLFEIPGATTALPLQPTHPESLANVRTKLATALGNTAMSCNKDPKERAKGVRDRSSLLDTLELPSAKMELSSLKTDSEWRKYMESCDFRIERDDFRRLEVIPKAKKKKSRPPRKPVAEELTQSESSPQRLSPDVKDQKDHDDGPGIVNEKRKKGRKSVSMPRRSIDSVKLKPADREEENGGSTGELLRRRTRSMAVQNNPEESSQTDSKRGASDWNRPPRSLRSIRQPLSKIKDIVSLNKFGQTKQSNFREFRTVPESSKKTTGRSGEALRRAALLSDTPPLRNPSTAHGTKKQVQLAPVQDVDSRLGSGIRRGVLTGQSSSNDKGSGHSTPRRKRAQQPPIPND